MIASRNVAPILEAHPDLRWVWWLPVEAANADELARHGKRLYKALRYHDCMPETYFWFHVERCDTVARCMVADRPIPAKELAYHWQQKYDACRPAWLAYRNADWIRRTVAAHCGMHDCGDAIPCRTGGSRGLPGISPRRGSAGQKSPPSNEIAYSQWTDTDGVRI